MRPPLVSEAELGAQDLTHAHRQHSYDLVQQLTCFIITIELVGCGYLLINAKELVGIPSAKYLYLIFGVAAFLGVLWRVLHNETYYRSSHGLSTGAYALGTRVMYWPYVILSVIAFVWAIYAGTRYLHEVSVGNAASPASPEEGKPPLPAPGQVRG